MAEVFLAGKDIADVHLDDWRGDGGDGIVDGHAGVAVAARIKHYAVGGEANGMEAVDELALDVALIVAYLYIRELLRVPAGR